MKMWSYTAGGLKIVHKITLCNKNRWSYNQGGLKIKGCKIEGPLYGNCIIVQESKIDRKFIQSVMILV